MPGQGCSALPPSRSCIDALASPIHNDCVNLRVVSNLGVYCLLSLSVAPSCLAQAESNPTYVAVEGAGGDQDAEADSSNGGSGAFSGTGGAGGEGGLSSGGEGGSSGSAGKAVSTGGAAGSAAKGGAAGSGGAAGTSGKAGAAGASGKAGTAGSAGCVDKDPEPNDTEATAFNLAGITDCDGTGASLTGTIDGASDTDWYSVYADDTFGCSVTPTFTQTSSETVTVCAYFLCDSGTTEVTCDSASQADSSPAGNSGCCSTASTFSPGVNCSGTSKDSTQISLVVKSTTNACLSYTIDYNY
jgi:hypothetical protein